MEMHYQEALEVYKKCGFICTPPVIESESLKYGACFFTVNNLAVIFRVANVTPTKIGQFVTLWKRSKNGLTRPYNSVDGVDLCVIVCKSEYGFGQFIFSDMVLYEKNIFSKKEKGGKRGIRVYPPWDRPTSKLAIKTQAWQLNYFLEIPENGRVDCTRAKLLYLKNGKDKKS